MRSEECVRKRSQVVLIFSSGKTWENHEQRTEQASVAVTVRSFILSDFFVYFLSLTKQMLM